MFRKAAFLPTLLLVAAFAVAVSAAPPADIVPKTKDPKVVKVLRTSDKAQSNNYVPEVLEIKHTNPYEVSSFLDDAVQAESGLVATYANPEDGGQSGLILVVVPEYQLPAIRHLAKQLDRPKLTNYSGTQYRYVNVKHRSVVNTHLAYTDPTHARTADFVESLLHFGGADTEITEDVETNSLLITGALSGVQAVASAIVDYDVPREQIDIAVRVYEVQVKNDASLGLDYLSWKNGPGRDLFTLSVREYNVMNDIQRQRVWDRGHISQYGSNMEYTSEFFDFLVVKGKASVSNMLRGTVINGFPATFQVFDDILHYPNTEHVYDEEGNRVSRIVEDQLERQLVERLLIGKVLDLGGDTETELASAPESEVAVGNLAPNVATALLERGGVRQGLLLRIRPTIARDNIDLAVTTSLQSFLSFDGRGIPLISERDVSTKVRAVSGQEVVLGGIRRERAVKMTRRVPVLGAIPVLGFLFGGEITGTKMMTVFEAVTPTVVEGGDLTESDREIIDRATRESQLRLPDDEFGFEQFGFDR